MSLLRFWPWKSCSPLRPGSAGGPEPSFGRKLLVLAQASSSVPSTEKCSLDSSVRHLRLRQHAGQELHRHLALQQPVAVLGEGGRIPHRIVDAKADEPAEQQVELDPLHQLALRADRVERLQQQRPQQPLRRDRLPAERRIKRVELRRERRQRGVDDAADHPQRMIRTDPLLQVHIAEQRPANRVIPPHLCLQPPARQRESLTPASRYQFQQPARPGSPPSVYTDVRNGLGCLINRSGVVWASFEATRGSYNFDNLDRTIDSCEAAGLKVLIPITGPKPDWAGGGFSAPTGAILVAYVNACRAIAKRYRDRAAVEAYEIWNEPDLSFFGGWTAAQYITVINAVAPAIKKVDPEVLVAGPALSQLPGDPGSAGTFASGILANAQAKANLDVFTGHAYCRPAAPEVGTRSGGPFDPRVAASLTKLANSGFNKPFWVTEMGWKTVGTPGPNTTAEQARYIVRGAVIIRARGVRVYQFEYKGDSGLVGNPSYAAYATLNRIVGNGLTGLDRVSHPTAWVYGFTRSALPTGYILWTVSGTVNVVLTGLTATVRTTTISGSQTIVSTSGGQLTVVAGIDPIYIENT